MYKYFIIYNNKTNLDVNLLIKNRPTKPSPVMRYEEIEVPGGKTLYIEKGYSDIEISIVFNFVSKIDEWDKDFRKIKEWLLSKKDNKLIFSDDLEYFYKVKKVSIETPERILKKIGRFTVVFTCEAYSYELNGTNEVQINNSIYNGSMLTKPIYRIVGEGLLTLTINNNTIKANVGQELIIDTELGLCYREGIINNVALQGNYEDMYLIEGENTFNFSEGFKIYITPNWRCL